MTKRIVAFLIALCLPTASAWAVGTCTVTNVTTTQNITNRIPDAETVIVTVNCTADASAATFPAATIPLNGSYPTASILNLYNLTGYILYAVGRTAGTTGPTANYTTVVTDNRGYALSQALMTGNGAASGSQFTWMSTGTAPYPVFPVVRSSLTVQISANAVNSAQVTLDLIFRTRP